MGTLISINDCINKIIKIDLKESKDIVSVTGYFKGMTAYPSEAYTLRDSQGVYFLVPVHNCAMLTVFPDEVVKNEIERQTKTDSSNQEEGVDSELS